MRRLGFTVLTLLSFVSAAQAQLSWPPQISVGQVWNISIQETGNWTLNLSRTDSDGPLGDATGTDARTGYFVYDRQNDAVLLALEGRGEALVCVFGRSGLRSNVLSGGAARLQNNQFQNINRTCTAVLQNAQGQQPLQPPAPPPAPPTPPVPTPPAPTPPVPVLPSSLSWP
ncbi:MAG: hypothetical protein HC933_23060, partial [Pleurocapsa sp. SU_196_0]|nr:hypothetical protein [Pleurocapsa sp. SU_196_0]